MADLSTGAAIAGYRIEAVLGRGSMGTVYSALDTGLERRVALKVLTPELQRDDRFRERFLRESKLAASLEHPHIVPIYSAGEAEGSLYLAMRYIEGRDLSALLKSLGRLDPERALAILRQVASALDVAHGRGLVHRDVKPANILLTRHGEGDDYAYLCDFGLAKHTSTVSSLTGSRAVVGTVDYLAPEQIEGNPVDGRVDVYALGCVLYESLTGVTPFERGNELAALLAHVSDPPPSLSERRADLPEALDRVVATALAKDRDLRYSTCSKLVEAAQAALSGEAPKFVEQPRSATAAVRTFVFVDVRGYTAYTRQHGDEAGAALARDFAAIVQEVAPRHAGTLQELRGDEALVVFDSARQALRFGVELQHEVERRELPQPVGIGLDVGEAVPVEGGFRGGALNRAARLCALARPGEVLASDAVRELAGTTPGVNYGFRRVERLKGFEKPVGVVEVHPADAAPGRDLGRRVRRAALGGRPRRRVVTFGVALGGAALVAALLATFLGGSGGPPPAARSVVGLDPGSGKITASADAGGEFRHIVTGDGVLYGLDADGGLIASIDPDTGAVTDRSAAPDLHPAQVLPALAYGSIWAADEQAARLLRFDPRAPASPIEIKLPNPTADKTAPQRAHGVAATRTGVWAAYGEPLRIARIDPQTNRVVRSRTLAGATALVGAILASDGDALWAVQRNGQHIWRLDPRSGDTLATSRITNDSVQDAVVEAGYLWVALLKARGVWKVDNRGTSVDKIETGAFPWRVAPASGALWVSNANDGTVTRIDPETDEARTVRVGHRPLGVGAANGGVLVSLGLSAEDARSRILGSRVVSVAVPGDPIDTTDCCGDISQDVSDVLAVRHATGAGLMGYRVGADSTAVLVPEVAAAPPVVSRDGLAYTFTVRKGFGFSPPSTGVVTAESIRYAIERARKQDDYCQAIFSVVRTIETRGNRIVFTLKEATGDLPARLSHPCAAAVPVGTPAVEGGIAKPIPSAGPYYPDTHVFGQQVVLLRNPNYGGTRPQSLDAIVLKLGYSVDEAARAVEQGDADLVVGEYPLTGALAPDGVLATKYGPSAGPRQRYFNSPTTTARTLLLNYTRGPLRDVRLRRAVSLALDRAAMSEAFYGTPQATIIPPGVPGRIEPSPGDARPAPARARTLVGGRPLTLDLTTYTDFPESMRVAELIRQALGRVGITVTIRTDANPISVAGDPRQGIDLVLVGWATDFPDPASSLVDLLQWTDAEVWKRPEKAPAPSWLRPALAARAVTGPVRARTFSALDRRISRVDVPVAVYQASLGRPVFFAERVGCRRFLPLWYGLPDLARLCLRGKS